MIRAILNNGIIQPVSPLPESWSEGQELVVDSAPSTIHPTDLQKLELEPILPEEQTRLLRAIDDHRQQQKSIVRQDMGLN